MKIQSISSISQKHYNVVNNRKANINFQQARFIQKPAKFITTAAALATAGVVTNNINDKINKKEILVQRIKENPEKIKNKLMKPVDKDGNTLMYSGILKEDDIIAINSAFVEAGEVDRLAEIHEVENNSQRSPIHSYWDEPETLFSTLNSLKTKPDTIINLVEKNNLGYDRLQTVKNLYNVKEILKDSPKALAAVLNSMGFVINKDTYVEYFNALKDVPEVLAELSVNVGGEYYEKGDKQVFSPYPQAIKNRIVQKYIDLAINSDLNDSKSLELLRRFEDDADMAGILSSAQNRSFQEELSNRIKQNLFDEIIS